MTPLRLSDAKWTFATRHVRRQDAAALCAHVGAARAGELILARVEKMGGHKRVQLSDGRHSALWDGDRIVVACGDRYAVDQFEGSARIAPDDCWLLAGGGLAGRLDARHEKMSAPTRLTPIGRVVDRRGAPLALHRYALPRGAGGRPDVVIGVVGAGMNAGKTTAAAALIRGLTTAGVATAGLKATGTGAFGDVQAYEAAGARHVGDFTDDGLASTYRLPTPRVVAALDALLGHAAQAGCEAAVVEIADGLLQRETAALLGDPGIAARFDGLVYAAGDALSALGGLDWLERRGLRALAVPQRGP